MILSGREIVTRQLVQNIRHITQQQQPCGIDLTLRQISQWTSPGTIDFDNTNRQSARTSSLSFDKAQAIKLQPGAYLVDFNETVGVPCDCMASIFPRSTLWRSGISIAAGVIDAGYKGALGALMEVKNPSGLILYKDAKLAQIVFEELKEAVDGYHGIYQSSTTSVGLDGPARSGNVRE